MHRFLTFLTLEEDINSENLIIFGFEQYLGSKNCFLKAHNDLHSNMK